MQQQLPTAYRLELALELRERQAREVARLREIPPGPPNRIQVAVGLRLVRLGQRLAAEPSFQPARPR